MPGAVIAFPSLRWLVLALVLLGGLGGGRAWAQDLELPGLDADAQKYAQTLRAKLPPQLNPAAIAAAAAEAAAAVAAHDMGQAVAALEHGIALGDNGAAIWMALARAQASLPKPNLERALQAGWLGLRRASQGKERVDDLVWLARLLDGPLNQPESARVAYDAAVSEGQNAHIALPEAEHRLNELRLAIGLTLKEFSVEANQNPAQFCLSFSDRLKISRDLHFEDFISLTPPTPITVIADGNKLCLSGLDHGAEYKLLVRRGLPGADGMVLKQDVTETVDVKDRAASVAFRGQSFILARGDKGDLPLVSVNVEKAKLKLYRINDRNLTTELKAETLWTALSEHDREQIKDADGEMVWQGTLDVHGERNKEAVTGVAIRTLIPDPKPGLYALTAMVERPDEKGNDDSDGEAATQWIMVSDLGLTTTRGGDGIHAMVRSLASAKPLAGVDVVVLARNNSELARATTDADGHVAFPASLTRGIGGQEPVMVTAYAHDGDFAMLDLTLAAFDLSDRGVGGRAQPGPMDAYLYTDRGVYRPGETVNLTALLRDNLTVAVDQFPLTVKVLRPSGTEFYAGTLKPVATGGYVLPLALSATAPMGEWTVEAYGDPKAASIGKVSFQVEAFVPERLAVNLTAGGAMIEPGHPFDVLVTSRFLYGAPAVGLTGTADVALEEDSSPYPDFDDYSFGLAQETVTGRTRDLALPPSDDAGNAHLTVDLPPQPDTTKPLRAAIHVAVSEPGGRSVQRTLSVPVRTQSYAIGIKPHADDGTSRGRVFDSGQAARFDVIAVDNNGKQIAKPKLTWEVLAEHNDFQWYYDGKRYAYRVTEHDQSIRSGSLAVTDAVPTMQDFGTLPPGRYRLEISEAGTGIASSLRFWSGWESSASTSDTPDTVEVTTDRPTYNPGETAHVHIQPPFAGEVLLTVATDRIHWLRTFSIPKTGGTVDVPVDSVWGPGAYVTATVYRPPVHGKDRLPVRAIGLRWVALDTASRTLKMAVDLPEVVRPNQVLDVPIKVTSGDGRALGGAAGPAYVTLAAVDEGILQLTQFDSPDPGQYYYAKRILGLDIRDDYSRLIDTVDGPTGILREGGDSSGLAAGLPKVSITVVSLFQGPVAVDAEGKATIRLTLPEFNGQLRLMAVAFDRTRLGALSTKLIMREPVVADTTLPRFLAPGDVSQMTVSLHNVEGPAGRYRLSVTGDGPVQFMGAPEPGSVATAVATSIAGVTAVAPPSLVAKTEAVVDLAAGARQELVTAITAQASGVGGVVVDVTGPLDGPSVVTSHQKIGLTVRPSRAVETAFTVRQLAPGGNVSVDASMLSSFVPGTAGLSLTLSSGPPFDVVGLLAALDRYPYGCLEQLVSRALPLLSVNEVAHGLGQTEMSEQDRRGRVNQAIAQVMDKQRYDGAFGLWSAGGRSEEWLTAYALEFLTRARALNYSVPEAGYVLGLTWLRHYVADQKYLTDTVNQAYAFYTLSLAGVATPGPMRYFFDTAMKNLPTPLAKAQIGAALARLGDRDRANAAFDAAMSELVREYWGADYGSTVRDAAALVTLLSEADQLTHARLLALLDRLPVTATAIRETNTQEQARLLLAANSLMQGGVPLALTRNGLPVPKGDPVRLVPGPDELAKGITVHNAGGQPVWWAVGTYGVPTVPSPAAREGFKIKRNFFWRDGTPVDLDAVKQNDVLVVVLEGATADKDEDFHAVIASQPLPAGWEIEEQAFGVGRPEQLDWLDSLSDPGVVELRDDRYVASLNLEGRASAVGTFKLAFAVRAVTPGSYEFPGAVMEDMHRPHAFARQAAGRITVKPAGWTAPAAPTVPLAPAK